MVKARPLQCFRIVRNQTSDSRSQRSSSPTSDAPAPAAALDGSGGGGAPLSAPPSPHSYTPTGYSVGNLLSLTSLAGQDDVTTGAPAASTDHNANKRKHQATTSEYPPRARLMAYYYYR